MKYIIIAIMLMLTTENTSAQKVFNIWPGKAPGSENWTWQEQYDSLEIPGDPLVYNIVQPTLTYYPADASVANGTSVIICAGGSFSYLHINTEGTDVAKWLNKKGVAAFVLKYRVVHSETSEPVKEKNQRMKDTAASRRLLTPIVSLGIMDAKQAIRYVRKHATELGINQDRIGIMGFSAGGTLAVASSFDYTTENKPDFVAPVYAYVPPALAMNIKEDAPPLFIAAATDDELHLVPMSINLYSKWLAAGHSAEIHVYSKGGHGFGMNKLNQPSDTWIERFGEWLDAQGLLKNK